MIEKYRAFIIGEEKAAATVKKYVRDASELAAWLGGRAAEKTLVLEYKEHLREIYAPSSVNAAISSLNSFFSFCGRHDLRMRTIKIQRRVFADKSREISREEYKSLIGSAGRSRLGLMLRTIFSTGIRISELRYITAESVRSGTAVIDCKGKLREILLPSGLCRLLTRYMAEKGIESGSVFVTRRGNPVDRSNVAKEMKRLAAAANVAKEKVFPHNLRHLFARTYYKAYKDIVRLADILGHSNVNTTRIYTMESCEAHRRQLDALELAAG